MSAKLGSDKYTYSNDDNDYSSSKYSSGRTSRGGGSSTGGGIIDYMSNGGSNGVGSVAVVNSNGGGVGSNPATPGPTSSSGGTPHHHYHHMHPPPPPLPPPASSTAASNGGSSSSSHHHHHGQQYHHGSVAGSSCMAHQAVAAASAAVSVAAQPVGSSSHHNHSSNNHTNNSSTSKATGAMNSASATAAPGCESVNSFEDSSVRNSQSGTTDGGGGGGGGGSAGGVGGGSSGMTGLSSSRIGSKLGTANNSSNYMGGSTDTISRNQRETLHSRFDFIKVLGKGTYGKVKLANDKRTGKQVAIKIIHKNRIENKQDLARVRREIEFMSRLNHPHIVKILEVYESSEKIILVMEYASGGELYDYLNERKRVSEVEARGIFRQIVSAVHFLHKNRIVHRDLKLENILIDSNGDIKLADFGLSNNWSPNSLLYTFCGSPLYASPEIVNGFPYFGPEVDCWSLGVLLYTLVYGSMPFQGGDYIRLVKQITEGQFIVPRERLGAFGLIKKCLCTKAAKRASIDDIAEHWWVNVGYAYPPVVFYSYIPGSSKSGGVQALGYEGSPKVSPSIPFGSMGKKTGSSLIAPSPAPTSTGGGGGGTSSSGAGQSNSAGANSTGGNGMTTPVPSAVY